MLANTSGLPSSKVFLPHLQPSVFSASRTSEGMELASRQTLPGGNAVAAVPVIAALALPAIRAPRQAAQRAQGMNQLKQIGLATLNFEAAQRAFPAGYNADANGKPLLSWRVHILPYVERGDLYQQFHLDEPWDSPHNKALIERMPRLYRAPESKGKPGMTNYLGVSGADGIFIRPVAGRKIGTGLMQITDGMSNTIMIVEAPDESAVIWTKPADFAPNKEKPSKGLVWPTSGGFNAGFADGSVRFISGKIDADTLRALFTKSGGDAVKPF
jgi:prepilin-type processing-associated H-X9-DG protein